MHWLLDGLMVVLFALCIVLGWHRGFIKTVSGLIALVAAVLVASVLSGPIANLVYHNTVEPTVMATLEEQIEGSLLPSAAELDGVLEKMPGFVTNLLKAGNLDSGAAILDKMDGTDGGATVAQRITQQVITPIVLPLIEMLCSVVLFILTYILAAILLRVLNVVAKLPLLKQLNKVLGLVAGVVNGALWVLFAVGVLQALAWLGWVNGLTPAVLNDTVLISWLSTLLPVIGA